MVLKAMVRVAVTIFMKRMNYNHCFIYLKHLGVFAPGVLSSATADMIFNMPTWVWLRASVLVPLMRRNDASANMARDERWEGKEHPRSI
jgi:hypothetical protein